METAPWASELTEALGAQFPSGISEFASYAGQNFLVCTPDAVIPILAHLRDALAFEYLVDITAVDYPERSQRFELIHLVYSFTRNEYVRIKTRLFLEEHAQSAVPVFAGANWLEREVYDMFGIEFAGHPNLRRILMPEEWNGFPLRKDYSILQMDNAWVQANLGIDSGR